MVSFRNYFTAALALAAPIAAQISPKQLVENINAVTQKSQDLQDPAQRITLVNGPLIVVGQGPFPEIIRGLTEIVSLTGTTVAQLRGAPTIPAGEPSDAVFEAFRDFVRVHQALLNILIGKAGLFSTVPVIGQPVAAVLRQVENVVDTIAFTLIDLVQSRATDLQAQAQSLSGTLETAVLKYEGLSLTKRSLKFPRREVAA